MIDFNEIFEKSWPLRSHIPRLDPHCHELYDVGHALQPI